MHAVLHRSTPQLSAPSLMEITDGTSFRIAAVTKPLLLVEFVDSESNVQHFMHTDTETDTRHKEKN